MSIQHLTSPIPIYAALAEFDRVGRTYFLEKYGFGKAREYMLRDPATGKLYDSKAIVGAAYGYAFPDKGPLRPGDFSGGEETVERLLLALGFQVVRIGQDWTTAEVELVVQDYFAMLRLESRGERYNKSERNDALRQRLPARSKASIELKHQNISAVLDQLGLPFVPGYKPRVNLQELLRQVVIRYVTLQSPALESIIEEFQSRIAPGEQQFVAALVGRPDAPRRETPAIRERLPRKLDYAAIEERNRLLGHAGEEWAIRFEQERLAQEGRPDLAASIDWTSNRLGDGAGYDILSSETTGVSRFIEVKTTNGGSLSPFVVTRNELSFSEEIGDAFCLYRLFDFAHAPRLFMLRGALESHVELEAVDYRARLRALA
jgi:hypothetical protein